MENLTLNENSFASFKDRLKEAMNIRGINQRQLAEKIKVTPQSISYYYNGSRLPDANVLRDIAKALEVSADYLLGMSDVTSTNIETKEISRITGLTEHSIARLRNETEYMCELSVTSMPQEALINAMEKYSDFEYPNFHIINLLLSDSPNNLNYAPIIEVLGEILEFKRQQNNEYYGLFKNVPKTDEEIFDTDTIPLYRLDYNDILDLLLVKLQGTIKRYKDENDKGRDV